MSVDQVEVRPVGDEWEVTVDGSSVVYPERKTAIAQARNAAGSVAVSLVDDDGVSHGTQRTPVDRRIVLLDRDGNEYGELDPGPSSADNEQRVDLAPAGEASEGGF